MESKWIKFLAVENSDELPHKQYIQLMHGIVAPDAARSYIHFRNNAGLGKVAMTAAGLGAVFMMHVVMLAYVVLCDWEWSLRVRICQWCIYFLVLLTFHFMEFFTTAAFNPRTCTWESFLLNHSKSYVIAATASWVEFFIEFFACPSLKEYGYHITIIGALVAITGQMIRSTAMWTATSNFTHLIAEKKRPNHRLVTNGVYTFLRHPGYFGWFW